MFNIYGDPRDKFSFIEKLIRLKKSNQKINLINNGNSIRDFIHVKDIAQIYKLLIEKKIKKGIYDLGTGKGYLIKDIIDYLNFSKSKIIKLNNINEIHNSIAKTRNLPEVLKNYKFLNLGVYLKRSLKINKKVISPIANYSNYTINHISNGTIIYGAGHAGKQIYHELRKNNEDISFFVDDDLKKQNTYYENTPIISYRNLVELKKNLKLKEYF